MLLVGKRQNERHGRIVNVCRQIGYEIKQGATQQKNTGNGLMFYFPKTSDSTNTPAFREILECGLTAIAANPVINIKLYEERLPSLSYRASANYGMVAIARSESSKNIDLFGSAVNVSAKIKRSEIIASILEVAYHACKHIKSNQRGVLI